MEKEIFFIKTITPLHVGSGSDLGVVDMPIQREVHTQFPKIEASSLKGSLKKEYKKDGIEKVFGKGDSKGKVSFSDARILFFPVKSAKGLFAYITCPYVLKRFKEDISFLDDEIVLADIQDLNDDSCIVLEDNINKIENNVILEEFAFNIEKKSEELKFEDLNLDIDLKRVVIVSDDNFKEFVKNSTEVNTRIRIGDSGVVEKGALFTEEYLPSESYMYSIVLKEIKDFKIKDFFNTPIQMGGNGTLGKGVVKIFGSVK